MFLFHGTRGTRETIRSIAREGLRPFVHAWTAAAIGVEDPTVFVSPTPVAGHGGDPVSFAMGFARYNGPRAQGDGWIVVFDVPTTGPDALSFAKGVVRNRDLDQHFRARSALRTLVESASAKGVTVLEALYELGGRDDLHRIASELQPRLRSFSGDASMAEPSFARWSAYADGILGARSREEVARLGRRYGVQRSYIEVPHCELCVQGLADWCYVLPANVKLACTEGEPIELPARYGRHDLFGQRLEANARMVRRWYEGAEPEAIARGFGALSVATWVRDADPLELLKKHTPIDLSKLPDGWTSGFGRAPTVEAIKDGDVQLVCDAMGPEHMIGAIHLSAGARFRPWARPTRDDRLPSKLWRAARWLRANSTRPDTIYDG